VKPRALHVPCLARSTGGAGALPPRNAPLRRTRIPAGRPVVTLSPMKDDIVTKVEPLGFPWQTPDPFLFCVHHEDAYPAGNAAMGPAVSLAGRDIGQDFAGKDGFRMYHGDVVPGFPQHPHRGFETVTVVRRGLVDHADSLGAAARYGAGDVQWLTAGKGIVHAEMFPLLERERENPLELFQIWLNLPREDKFVDPHFSMLWSASVPEHVARDAAGRATAVTVVAGALGDARPPAPPPRSWASRADTDVAIWTIAMEPGAHFVLPAASPGTNRMLYVFRGAGIRIGDRPIPSRRAVELRAGVEVPIENGPEASEMLVLQGRPLGEPVVQYGPFVMSSEAEIRAAFADYQRTRFGGWPWPSDGPVHGREGRFARHADGRVDRPA
jgi:redox-sensitive bicupin YhaK (pirin superfamily)